VNHSATAVAQLGRQATLPEPASPSIEMSVETVTVTVPVGYRLED